MRGLFLITLWLLTMAVCPAQQQEQSITKRLELQMADYRNGKSSPLNDKQFDGSSAMKLNAASDKSTSFFNSKKKFGSDSFSTRSFFGLKNPWFGKKVFTSDSASLWTKSDVANADKKFAVSPSQSKAYKDSKKSMNTSTQVVEEKPFIAKGKAQGALDESKKDLSIDDVRSILNKNH